MNKITLLLLFLSATGLAATLIKNKDIDPGAAIQQSKMDPMTANRAVVTDSSGFETPSTTTAAQIGMLSTLSSDVQTQLNGKQASLGYTAENVANKDTNTSLGTSDTKYPSQNAVKAYVDAHTGGAPAWGDITGTLTDQVDLAAALALLAPIASPTFTGSVTAPIFVGALTGNATTATAFASNPTGCSSGQYAHAIDAQGNFTCSTPSGGGGGGSPGGSDQQVQFNDSGSFAGAANTAWDKSANSLYVGGGSSGAEGGAFNVIAKDSGVFDSLNIISDDRTQKFGIVQRDNGDIFFYGNNTSYLFFHGIFAGTGPIGGASKWDVNNEDATTDITSPVLYGSTSTVSNYDPTPQNFSTLGFINHLGALTSYIVGVNTTQMANDTGELHFMLSNAGVNVEAFSVTTSQFSVGSGLAFQIKSLSSGFVRSDSFGNMSSSALSATDMPAYTGDTTSSAGSTVTTTSKVHGVSYPASPSTNTVPVITSSNTVTYEAIPNAALVNPSMTVNGTTCTLGGSCSPSGGGTSKNSLSAHFDQANSNFTNSGTGSYSDMAVSGTANNFVIDDNNGFTSPGAAASKVAGITFTPPRTGRIKIEARFNIENATTGGGVAIQLTDGTTVIDQFIYATPTSNQPTIAYLSGVYNLSATTATTWKIQSVVASGQAAISSTGASTGGGGYSIKWNIYYID